MIKTFKLTVCSPVTDKQLDIGMTQKVILGNPFPQSDVRWSIAWEFQFISPYELKVIQLSKSFHHLVVVLRSHDVHRFKGNNNGPIYSFVKSLIEITW